MNQNLKRFLQDCGGALLAPFIPGVVGAGVRGVTEGATVGSSAREGKTGETIMGQAHGKYHEAVSRGGVFCVTTGAAANAQAPGTTLAVTVPITIFNPLGSGVRLSILAAGAGYVSGTLGAGSLFHAGYHLLGPLAKQTDVLPTGTAVTPNNCLIGGAPDTTTLAFFGATLNAAPSLLYPFAILNAMLASTQSQPFEMSEDVDGKIELDEGGGYCLTGITLTAAGTPLLSYSIVYERIPKS